MVFLRLGGVFMRLLNWLLTPLYMFYTRSEKRTVSRLKDPVLEISAVRLAEKIRNQELTSEQIVKSYIKRIKEVNDLINAVVEDRFVAALTEAKEADSYVKDHSEENLAETKPLLGVPITIKESCRVKGLSICGGTLTRLEEKSYQDSETVARLKQSGAIILLVSNTPELCLSWECNNFVTGRARNPYNLHHTCGGSSGGEGALLGSGASLVGVGSDLAGSVRVPAMFNGVFGHKPTSKVVPLEGHFPSCGDENFLDYLSIGPMTRYAEDLLLMMKVMTGDTSKELKLDEKVDLKNLNIFTLKEVEKSPALVPVQREIKKCIDKAARHMEKNCGSSLSDYKFDFRNTIEMSTSLFFEVKDAPNILNMNKAKEEDNLWIEMVKSALGLSMYTFQVLFFNFLIRTNGFVPKDQHKFYKVMAKRMKKRLMEKLGDNGVLFYPTFPTSAFLHNQSIFHITSAGYAMLFNILGMPSCHVPLGFDQNGMPIGIQVVAAPYQDRLCLAVAKELEDGFGGWKPPMN